MQFHLLAFVKTVFFVLAALLPIMNPPGNAPIFHSLTAGASDATRNALAWRVAVNTFILLVAGMFIGTHVLAFFGVSLPVVKVAGGLLVIATAWKLLNTEEVQKVETIPGSLWTKELASKKPSIRSPSRSLWDPVRFLSPSPSVRALESPRSP